MNIILSVPSVITTAITISPVESEDHVIQVNDPTPLPNQVNQETNGKLSVNVSRNNSSYLTESQRTRKRSPSIEGPADPLDLEYSCCPTFSNCLMTPFELINDRCLKPMGDQIEKIEDSKWKCGALFCGLGRVVKCGISVVPRTVGLTCACANSVFCGLGSAASYLACGKTKKGHLIAKAAAKIAKYNLNYCKQGLASCYSKVRFEAPLYIAKHFIPCVEWRTIRQSMNQFFFNQNKYHPAADAKNSENIKAKKIADGFAKCFYMKATSYLSGASEYGVRSHHNPTQTFLDQEHAEMARKIANRSVENSVNKASVVEVLN